MEDTSDNIEDYENTGPIKLSFPELQNFLKTSQFIDFKNRGDIKTTLYYYCKDKKKHGRILEDHFWSIIVPFIHCKEKKIQIFGMKLFNELVKNEGTHDKIVQLGVDLKSGMQNRLIEGIEKVVQEDLNMDMNNIQSNKELQNEIKKKAQKYVEAKDSQTPIMIIVKIIKVTDSTIILNEAAKAIRSLAVSRKVMEILYEHDTLNYFIQEKLEDSDTYTQQMFLETISIACSYQKYRKKLQNEDIIMKIFAQIKSISPQVTYAALKIAKKLSYDKDSQEILNSPKLNLPHVLIYTFRWLDVKLQNKVSLLEQNNENNIANKIFRQIAETFMNILQFHENHNKILHDEGDEGHSIIIYTIVQLGRCTQDFKTTLYAACSLAHITEILECHQKVASEQTIRFMTEILKDSKNLAHHRQGCRFFANLSFQKEHRDKLIENEIATYLLKAIDGCTDKDTIKHSAIALANLSSHKDFMKNSISTKNQSDSGETAIASKAEKWKIKPLIHLLDSDDKENLNLIQSACITLCNMASKPSLHNFFIHEPEITTIKNCLHKPIDKELTRFMIKLVCNLTKNTNILHHLVRKGFLEILFDLLNHEQEKEIFGNVVTAISYLSVNETCQKKIISNSIIPRILEPLCQSHDVDQKLIIIALTSMLFNGSELQEEFIKHDGLGKLLFFMTKKEKIFQQLACKCFSLLSENNENLQKIIEQECLNTIIISCLRTKEIDLETLKEITKIFINLILWRKLDYVGQAVGKGQPKPKTIIRKAKNEENKSNDAIVPLGETSQTHNDQMSQSDINNLVETTCCLCDIGLMISDQDMNVLSMFCLNALSENPNTHTYIRQINSGEDDSGFDGSNQSSIFTRINHLLENLGHKNQSKDGSLSIGKNQDEMDNLLLMLINSFYLNLARNHENIKYLLKLKIFDRLKHMHEFNYENDSSICYANTIFSKILRNQESHQVCIQEGGHELFLKILDNKSLSHLYLETLDSIKLLLTNRQNLTQFGGIAHRSLFNRFNMELNVSFLQVLAILSFEKQNHEVLKQLNIINELDSYDIFKKIFKNDDQKKLEDDQRRKPRKRLRKVEENNNEQKELQLALSIIVANLSSDRQFIDQIMHKTESQDEDNTYLRKILNLLADNNKYISEQASIILANLTNTDNFKPNIITDRCIKALIKIITFNRKAPPTNVSMLAVLITILNLTTDQNIAKGLMNLDFIGYLENIIQQKSEITHVNKAIALLAISNMITLDKSLYVQDSTQDFAMFILKNWEGLKQKEEAIIVNNLIYSSLILFYNTIVNNHSQEKIEMLGQIIQEHLMVHDKKQIIDVILEIITLFTRNQESCNYVLNSQALLQYAFTQLESEDPETLKFASLALSRLAASLSEKEDNMAYFQDNISQLNQYSEICDRINLLKEDVKNEILMYYLNFLENATSFQKLRVDMECQDLYKSLLTIFNNKINSQNCLSIINILFNINMTIESPMELKQKFLKHLCKKYYNENELDEKMKRKVMIIVVSATADCNNHRKIIEYGFYTLFKMNLNDNYSQLKENDEEIELFGLVNIALNKKNLRMIYPDLKNVHRMALQNDKIDFKTCVDLFSECSKFVSSIYSERKQKDEPITDKETEIIEKSLKAVLFSMIKLIEQVRDDKPLNEGTVAQRGKKQEQKDDFLKFKYLLNAMLECSKNFKPRYLQYLVKIDKVFEFLLDILKNDYKFQISYDDKILNFSLRVIVCSIFFNLKSEKTFFARDDIQQIIKYLIDFANLILKYNIDKKMPIVSNTLRLISQMVASIFASSSNPQQKLKDTDAIKFVNNALQLSKDIQPSINIDALFCLTNMMNIKDLAMDEQLCQSNTVNLALLIYVAYSQQVDLEECIITFLYTISQYTEYQKFMKEKSQILFELLQKHIKKGKESCIKKIFSTIHNLTENQDICQNLQVTELINLTTAIMSSEHVELNNYNQIHEIALKSLINVCKNNQDAIEDQELTSLFEGIDRLYDGFEILAQQYSLRLITILVRNWREAKIEKYVEQVIKIVAKFISKLRSENEMKLVTLILEKIASFKKQLQIVAKKDTDLLKSIASFIKEKMVTGGKSSKKQFQSIIEQFLKFCKKLSKHPFVHDKLIQYDFIELGMNYIENEKSQKIKDESIGNTEEGMKTLKQNLETIQNIMKMIRNIYEGTKSLEDKTRIQNEVKKREDVIETADHLLTKYKDDGNISIIIVNIIISFNSINNQLEKEKVESWIDNFSNRFIQCSKNTDQKEKNYQMWYMEKYIFILELLVTKNINDIDKSITEKLLEMSCRSNVEKANFTKTIWYKIVKILAHLQFLHQLFNDQKNIQDIFKFILEAYSKTKENLCFYYIMKIVMQIKQSEIDKLLKQNQYIMEFFEECVKFFREHHKEKSDSLILEIQLYLIDFFKFLMDLYNLHEILHENDIIYLVIVMLKHHDNPAILKSLASCLQKAAKYTIFYSDLLNENAIDTIVRKIVLADSEQETCQHLYECMKDIIINTKVPVKYLISLSVLRLTDPKEKVVINGVESCIISKHRKEANIIQLINLLKNVLNNLVGQDYNYQDSNEVQEELSKKAHKFALVAFTNILIRHDPRIILHKRVPSTLIEKAQFEFDSQIHLRFMYLVSNVLQEEDILKDLSQEICQKLIQFIVSNIYKFRQILRYEDDYDIEIQPLSYKEAEGYGNKVNQSQKMLNSIHDGTKEGDFDDLQSKQSSVVQMEQDEEEKKSTAGKDGKMVKNGSEISILEQTQQDDQSVDSKMMNSKMSSEPLGFYFEKEDFTLTKLDGLKMSLCMSIKILDHLSQVHKRFTCTTILKHEHFEFLYDYFHPFLKENASLKCNEHIQKVLDIIDRSAQIGKLENEILNNETVSHLLELLSQALEFNQRKMILSILKIFVNLTSAQKFHNDLMSHNAFSLLDKIRENEDGEIKATARDLFEKVVENQIDEKYIRFDIDSNELESIQNEAIMKQITSLEKFESMLNQKKIKTENISEKEIEVMIRIFKRPLSNEAFGPGVQPYKEPLGEDLEILKVKQIMLSVFIILIVSNNLKDEKLIQLFTKERVFEHLGGICQKETLPAEFDEKATEFLHEFCKNQQFQNKDGIHQLILTYLKKQNIQVKPYKKIIECLITILQDCEEYIHQFDMAEVAEYMLEHENSKDETVLSGISTFIKIIFFNHNSTKPQSELDAMYLQKKNMLLKKLLISEKKELEKIGFFCLFSMSLNECSVEQLIEIDAIKIIFNQLSEKQHQKSRINAFKTLINWMEVSNLEVALLEMDDYKLLDYLYKFSKSDSPDERKLAARGFAKISLQILEKKNPMLIQDFPKELIGSENDDISDFDEEFTVQSFIQIMFSNLDWKNNTDPDIHYFSLYSIFNILMQINVKKQSGQFKELKDDDDLSEEEKGGESTPAPEGEGSSAKVDDNIKDSFDQDKDKVSDDSQVSLRNRQKAMGEMIDKKWNDLTDKDFNLLLIKSNIIYQIILLIKRSKDEDVVRIALKILILITFKVSVSDLFTKKNSEDLYSDLVKNFPLEQVTGESYTYSEAFQNVFQFFVESVDSYSNNYFINFMSYVFYKGSKDQIDLFSMVQKEQICELLSKLCGDYREDETMELLGKVAADKKKLIIYKYFFINLMVNILLKNASQGGQSILNLNINSKVKQFSMSILDAFKDKNVNASLEVLFDPEVNELVRNHSKKLDKLTIIGVILKLCMGNLLQVCKEAKNMETPTLTEDEVQVVLINLKNYKEAGELVDLIYQYFIEMIKNKGDHIRKHYIELLESSQELVKTGMEHTAVFKSKKSADLLNLLVEHSSKYGNKKEAQSAVKTLLSKNVNQSK